MTLSESNDLNLFDFSLRSVILLKKLKTKLCRQKTKIMIYIPKMIIQKTSQVITKCFHLSTFIDPIFILQAQPEFIFLDGVSKQNRCFELDLRQIRGSCMIGAALGGASGFYNGLKATTLAGQTGKLRRTQ